MLYLRFPPRAFDRSIDDPDSGAQSCAQARRAARGRQLAAGHHPVRRRVEPQAAARGPDRRRRLPRGAAPRHQPDRAAARRRPRDRDRDHLGADREPRRARRVRRRLRCSCCWADQRSRSSSRGAPSRCSPKPSGSAGPIEKPPLHLQALRRASVVAIEPFLDGCAPALAPLRPDRYRAAARLRL